MPCIPLDLPSVRSLKDHYESPTIDAMTRKISSIAVLKGLKSPMKIEETMNNWVPDFPSRYFTADFSFGLKIIKDIADEFGVDTPNIDKVWKWYADIVLSDNGVVFEIPMSIEQMLELYMR